MINDLDVTARITIAQAILSHGTAVSTTPDRYGWDDTSIYSHFASQRRLPNGTTEKLVPCTWVVPTDPVVTENTYLAFDGTFNDSSPQAVLDVTNVTCACGQYTRTVRYEGSIGSFLPLIFK